MINVDHQSFRSAYPYVPGRSSTPQWSRHQHDRPSSSSPSPPPSSTSSSPALIASARAPTPSPCSFHCFSQLPPEIRALIWTMALPDDVPELYVLQSFWVRPGDTLPTVSTAYPALMHTCRESRSLAQSVISLRWLPEAQCEIPYRDFRPDLDVFFIPASSFVVFFSRPATFFGDLHTRLQHIAIDVALTTNELRMVETLRHLRSLRTVSVVFGQSTGTQLAGTLLKMRSPTKRWGLRPFTDRELQCKIRSSVRPIWAAQLGQYLALYRDTLEKVTSAYIPPRDAAGAPELLAWDHENRRLNLEVNAQVFREYQPLVEGGRETDHPRPGWVELGPAVTQQIV